nr:putative reverse transcriptase domain-containing protein [Tanacetum cinerariifolium]
MMAATEPKTIQKAVQIAGTLTNEAFRNGSIKKNPEKRGNGREPSKDRNVKDEIRGLGFWIQSRSFNVIIGMDWLSNHKAEIIYHEKLVRIPLPDDKVLRVIGERPDEKVRYLNNQKQGNARAMTTALNEGKVSSGSLPVIHIPYENETLIVEMTKDKEEQRKHLKIILELLKKEKLDRSH